MREITSNQRRLAHYLLYIPIPCLLAYAAFQVDEGQAKAATIYGLILAVCIFFFFAIGSVEKQFGLRIPTRQDVFRFLFGFLKITFIMGLLEAFSARDIRHVLPAMGVYWAFVPFLLPMIALKLPRLGESSPISHESY